MLGLIRSGGDTALGPLLPASYDVAWWLVLAALVTLVVVALARIARSRALTTTSRVVWVLLVILTVPIGAIASLFLVRGDKASRTAR